MINNIQEFYSILPLIIVAVVILVSVTLEMFTEKSEQSIAWLSVIVLLITGIYSLISVENTGVTMQGMLATGGIVNIFWFIFNVSAAIVCLLSIDYIKKYGSNFGEYYIIIQTSVLGMMLIAGSKDLIMIFLGLEIMSIAFYVLAGFNRTRTSANEASLKYFLLGAFATGFLVYGIALIYGKATTMFFFWPAYYYS
jgi:NADH-quinone oxidoreductase subunit N